MPYLWLISVLESLPNSDHPRYFPQLRRKLEIAALTFFPPVSLPMPLRPGADLLLISQSVSWRAYYEVYAPHMPYSGVGIYGVFGSNAFTLGYVANSSGSSALAAVSGASPMRLHHLGMGWAVGGF